MTFSFEVGNQNLISPQYQFFSALISNGCFAPGVTITLPSTLTEELSGSFAISLKLSNSVSKTI